MPQMSPLNWVTLMGLFLINVIFLINKIYTLKLNNHPSYSSNKITSSMYQNKWLW